MKTYKCSFNYYNPLTVHPEDWMVLLKFSVNLLMPYDFGKDVITIAR